MRILLVEDDGALRGWLARQVGRFCPDATVDCVGTLDHALNMSEARDYQLLLVDVCLRPDHEDRSGALFVKAVRSRGSRTPAILMSGILDWDLALVATEAGAQAWYPKGPSRVEFLGTLLRAVVSPPTEAQAALPADLRLLASQAKAMLDITGASQAQDAAVVAGALARLAAAALACETFRGSAVQACAQAVGLERNTLGTYAPLARWSFDKIARVLQRRNANGEHLGVSHLLLLAPLPEPAAEEITDRVLSECLTVRDLRAVVANRLTAPSRRPDMDVEATCPPPGTGEADHSLP